VLQLGRERGRGRDVLSSGAVCLVWMPRHAEARQAHTCQDTLTQDKLKTSEGPQLSCVPPYSEREGGEREKLWTMGIPFQDWAATYMLTRQHVVALYHFCSSSLPAQTGTWALSLAQVRAGQRAQPTHK